MSRVVAPQIPGRHRIRQHGRLPETQPDSFPRNRIHRARRISHQRDIAPRHRRQAQRGRRGTPFPARGLGPAQPLRQPGKTSRHRLFQPQMRIPRDQRRANLAAARRRDVNLAAVAPVDFHMPRPRRHREVPAKRIPARAVPDPVQPRPAAHLRTRPIGTDYPVRLHDPGAGDRLIPAQVHARLLRRRHQQAMQRGTPHAQTFLPRKVRLHRKPLAHEAHSAKLPAGRLGNRDAERRRRPARFRHQALSARLIDGRTVPVRQHHAQPFPARRDSRRQPRRTAADHEHVRRRHRTPLP